MYLTITIIIIILEIAFIAGLIKLYIILNNQLKRMPEYQELILQEIIRVREELKELNKKLESRPPDPLSPKEIGQVLSGILPKILLQRKIPVFRIFKAYFKYKDRIPATISKYQTS